MSELFVALTPSNLLACLAGTVLGTVVGVLPGLGPAGAMALVLPVIVTLGPTAGLIMLAGIYYGSMYGGSTTSILVNVPGEAASVVTAIDGYRLARRGRAGAALAVAALASFVAGTFSVVALQLAAPLVARTALAFGPAEYFAFALLGLVLLANLTGGSRPKSLAMVALGIMLSTVGMDPLGGTVRFAFGLAGSEAGLSFIAVTAGLFGVAEVLAIMAAPAALTPVAHVRFRELYPSREELRRAAPPMLRGTALGFLVGLVPGPAATIASFVSYGVEKKVSRYRDELGRGAIEGVAGPEAANNAAAGAGMIPLLSLGLPFTPATAVLLSGMLLTGVTPGPFLLRDHPEVFWGVIGSFYVGNVMLLLLNLPLVGLFARVATIPPRWLMPGVLVLCAVAAFADNNNPFDVWVLVGAGLLGYAMRGLGYDPAPLVLGLVLGPLLERSLLQALTIGRGRIGELWASPQAAVMLAAAAVALLAPAVAALVRRTTVRSAALALALVLAAGPSVAGATPALDGAWTVARVIVNGAPRGDGKLLNATWTFRGAELVVEYAGGERLRAALTFDATSAPPAVRVTPLDAPGERPVWMIIARQADELRLAFYDGLDRRPEDFAPRPKLVVLTLVPSTAASAPGDPCEILRAAGADLLLGGPTRARPEPRRGSAAGPSCALARSDGGGTVSLALIAPPAGQAYVEAARQEVQAGRRVQIEDEPALGAGAFSGTRGLTVVMVALKQGTAMVLRFEAPGVERAELRRFAQRVFDRL